MKESKEKQMNEQKQLQKTSHLKDDILENLLSTAHRAETKRDEKLMRIYGKASHLFAEIKRQHEEIKDINQLKSTDLILLHQRLRNTEHKIKQLQTSLKIKLTRLIQEEKSISSSLHQLNKEMTNDQIDVLLLNDTDKSDLTCYPKKGSFGAIDSIPEWKREPERSKKIIEELIQELHSFKIREVFPPKKM